MMEIDPVEPHNVLTVLPPDIWMHVVGPQLLVRDLVAFSMTCRRAREILHQVSRHPHSTDTLVDKSTDLHVLRTALQSWPTLRIKFEFRDNSHTIPEALLEEDLRVMGKVQTLEIQFCRRISSFDFVDRSKLYELTITNSQLSDAAFLSLTAFLRTASALASLSLIGCEMDALGGKYLGEVLSECKCLTALDIKHNSLGPEGGRAMGVGLGRNGTLTALNIRSNELGSEGGRHIADSLRFNTHLTSLVLEDNDLRTEGGRAVGDALKTNSTLKSLMLWKNGLGPEGVRLLAEGLKINTSLTELGLEVNGMGVVGAMHIASAVMQTQP